MIEKYYQNISEPSTPSGTLSYAPAAPSSPLGIVSALQADVLARQIEWSYMEARACDVYILRQWYVTGAISIIFAFFYRAYFHPRVAGPNGVSGSRDNRFRVSLLSSQFHRGFFFLVNDVPMCPTWYILRLQIGAGKFSKFFCFRLSFNSTSLTIKSSLGNLGEALDRWWCSDGRVPASWSLFSVRASSWFDFEEQGDVWWRKISRTREIINLNLYILWKSYATNFFIYKWAIIDA